MSLTEKEWDEWTALTKNIAPGEWMPQEAFFTRMRIFGCVSTELAVMLAWLKEYLYGK